MLHIDQVERNADLEVVARLEVELGRLAGRPHELGVLLGHAVRRRGVGQVRQLRQEPGDAGVDPGQLLLERLDLLGERVRFRDLGLGVLAGALGLRDPLGDLLLVRPPVLQVGQDRAAAGIRLQQLVDPLSDAGAPAGEGGLDAIRVAANQLEVERG
jgi:hypothetical protein